MGLKYLFGRGVIEDPVRAHIWANIAASYAYQDGVEMRDKPAAILTRSQLAKAYELARRCTSKGLPYKNC
jgi:hypothetical protein